MYELGKTVEQITHLVELTARVRVNIFRLTHITDARSVPYEIGSTDEPSYVVEKHLRSDVDQIRNSITDLLGIYAGCPPQENLEKALVAIESVAKATADLWNVYADGITFRDVMKSLLGADDWTRASETVARRVLELQPKIQTALEEVTKYVYEMMPIPFSAHIQARIGYDVIRRSPQSAIQLAFAVLEDQLRDRIGVGSEVYGEDLINAAFAKEGRLVYSQLAAEQVGARNLCSGAYATLRNPRMHRLIEDDETTAITVIALIDLLIQMTEKSQSR
jgi:hypothetical protein